MLDYLGFSWKGVIVFLLPMIPNIFYFLIPASDVSSTNVNTHLILDVLEHGSQAIFIFLLIFVTRKQTSEILCQYTIGMAIILICYYALWIFCFTGKANLGILLGMAVIPVVYFILAEMWLHNYLAIIPTVIFGVLHVIITYMDFSIKILNQ
ncbi:hypothetical protein G9F72_004495 [Clostridium estertheticum]|uniref:hypothetical protein n=1 Tax=Clostridium estertheticum TaxID=238834 RepID=UPI0013E92C92|nr:hypothetical protein [Clostridium estertheticum]MBZ9685611.1 hypothetical protein [Clostridium estertheticum]